MAGFFKKKTGNVYAGPVINCVYAGPEQMPGYVGDEPAEISVENDPENTDGENAGVNADNSGDAKKADTEKIPGPLNDDEVRDAINKETEKQYPFQNADMNMVSGIYAAPKYSAPVYDPETGNQRAGCALVYAGPAYFNRNADSLRIDMNTSDFSFAPATPKKAVFCTNCGFRNENPMNFCPECGTRLVTADKN
ncbi:MAG: zinc-ribbon domain-containing protein [Clostridia bacterium]|nr:zinc-ribbon domain-containing protein [Clostridia bacterium]